MQKYPAIILHSNKTHAVKRFHPWVFSGAVKRKDGNPYQGDVVEVFSESGEYLGIGHFGTGSVSVRIFSFDKISSLDELWKQKLLNAFNLRRNIGLTENKTPLGAHTALAPMIEITKDAGRVLAITVLDAVAVQPLLSE